MIKVKRTLLLTNFYFAIYRSSVGTKISQASRSQFLIWNWSECAQITTAIASSLISARRTFRSSSSELSSQRAAISQLSSSYMELTNVSVASESGTNSFDPFDTRELKERAKKLRETSKCDWMAPWGIVCRRPAILYHLWKTLLWVRSLLVETNHNFVSVLLFLGIALLSETIFFI